MKALKIVKGDSYKIGVDEVEGLKDILKSLISPVVDALKDNMYWNDKIDLNETEYKSRDGFIPYNHNLGGIEISEVIPKCEEYNFGYLEFGEYEERPEGMTDDEYDSECQSEEGEGRLDARLRIWLKLEYLEGNTMGFYLYMGGGSGDAPYFRTKYEQTLFESEFEASSLEELKINGKQAIEELLKVIK